MTRFQKLGDVSGKEGAAGSRKEEGKIGLAESDEGEGRQDWRGGGEGDGISLESKDGL